MPNGMVKAWPIWLSHMHILVWLKEKLRTDPKDKIISAEIPYSSSDKTPWNYCKKYAFRDPCGIENPQCPWMKNGKCTEKLSPKLIKETVYNDNEYPLHCRRAPADGGWTVSVKLQNGSYVRYSRKWLGDPLFAYFVKNV